MIDLLLLLVDMHDSRVDHLIPRQADSDLLRELQELRTYLERLRLAADPTKPTDDIVHYAQTVFNDGATLYKSSVAEGSIADDMENLTIVDKSAHVGSDWIRQWSSDVPLVSLDRGSSPATASSEPIFSVKPSPLTADTSIDDDPSIVARNSAEACDSDDDLDLEIAEQTISDGSAAFDENKFVEADVILSDAVHQLQRIPAHRRSVDWISDIQYKLAVCAYHLQAPEEAVKRLVAFVQNPAENDTARSNVCNAGYLLAQMYVRLDKLETARATCDSALRGRRRLLGPQHQEYYESMALMARIMELQGNKVRSNTWMRRIPDDQQHRVISMFAQLGLRSLSERSDGSVTFQEVHAEGPTIFNEVSEEGIKAPASTDSSRHDKQTGPPQHVQVVAPLRKQHHDLNVLGTHRVTELKDIKMATPRQNLLEALGWVPKGPLELKMAHSEGLSGIEVADIGHFDPTTLVLAALLGEYNVVEALLNRGAFLDAVRELPSRFSVGERTAVKAIHVAVAAKQPAIIELLLQRGGSVKGRSSVSCIGLLACLLHPEFLRLTGCTAFEDVLPTLQALQKFGVNVHTVDSFGYTMLHWVASLPNEFVPLRPDLVRYFLARGSNVLKACKMGRIPLHYGAYMNSSTETIAALLEHRTLEQLNAMDIAGQTPLHRALAFTKFHISPSLVRYLVKAGSDSRYKLNKQSQTPYNLAEHHKQKGHLDKDFTF